MKGLRYIASLLAGPGRQVHVFELVSAASGAAAGDRVSDAASELVASRPADGGPLLDDQAKDEYGRRLELLDDELEEARAWGDIERAARVEEEIDLLTRELARTATVPRWRRISTRRSRRDASAPTPLPAHHHPPGAL